jgi:hypothetical protein
MPVCQFHKQNRCMFGTACRNIHEVNTSRTHGDRPVDPRSNIICKYYIRNVCERGVKCPFSHTVDSSTGTALDQRLGHNGSKEVQDSSACPACGGKPHEQLVCADVKAGKRERNDVNDARNCRTCLMPLPKLECADLVICAACKTQICWQCEEEFEVNATAEVFNHFDVFEDRGRNNP